VHIPVRNGDKQVKIKPTTTWIVYGFSFVMTAALLIFLYLVIPKDNFFFSFLFRFWPVQALNTWLFLIALLFWRQRYRMFRREEDNFELIQLPKFRIDREKAHKLIESMPKEYQHTITLRRYREILQAFIYGEDILRLNVELSTRDRNEAEQGHLILSALRNIIPITGFLGTVVGLSSGMIKFPDVNDIAVLRTALKDFAASLSVAFDTTLLALAFTIVVILLTSFLRQIEELQVSKVNDRARILIDRLKMNDNNVSTQSAVDANTDQGAADKSLPPLLDRFTQQTEKVVQNIDLQNKRLVEKIEQIQKATNESFAGSADRICRELRISAHLSNAPAMNPSKDDEKQRG